KIATPFGGGMASQGETCGAVTGALMVIGLRYGNISNWRGEDAAKDKTYATAMELISRFKSINGTVRCKELLGCDLSTPEGRELSKERNLFTTLCPKFVRDAAEIVKELL
ncbi:MAG: C-GCAxxG-C-C family protein, partial [Desulfocucumaceae bacterium]